MNEAETFDEAGWIADWQAAVKDLQTYRMPFGRYHGVLVVDLPEEYLMWFRERGYPKGRLGELMEVVCEIKVSGAEQVLKPFREKKEL